MVSSFGVIDILSYCRHSPVCLSRPQHLLLCLSCNARGTQLVPCLEGHHGRAGVWLPRVPQAEASGQAKPGDGAQGTFGSLSAHGRTGGTILASLAQCMWDSTADLPVSPGSLQHTVRAGQHHHRHSGCPFPRPSSS